MPRFEARSTPEKKKTVLTASARFAQCTGVFALNVVAFALDGAIPNGSSCAIRCAAIVVSPLMS